MMLKGPGVDLSRPRLSPGTRLNGIYEIDELIDVGGMGEVYKGHSIQTGDAVAIKLMLPEFAENEAALALFRREASALHNLQHDAIVRYYVFTVEPVLRRPYLAMEFVEGRSLSKLLQDNGPLPFEAVRSLMRRVATGLQAAHERGIVHRDVTPGNIIIPGGDVARAKIIDFGIARSSEFGDRTIIGSGFAGKHNYVSPEQLGLFGGNVTAKSDIYSFGLVLFQALTGCALDMGGTQLQIVEKRRVLPELGAIDMRLRPLLERMLQPNPAQRLDSMAAVAAWSLGAQMSGGPSGMATASDPRSRAGAKARKGGGRAWRSAAAAVVVILLFAGGAGYYYWATSVPVLAPRPGGQVLNGAGAGTNQATVTSGALSIPPSPQAGASTQVRPSTPSGSNADSGKLAALPARPEPPVTTRTDLIKRYVDQFDGGECFLITPVAISDRDAALEGLGASMQPFNRLDQAFKRDNGFEADIAVRQVTPAQCPAVSFLARLRDTRTGAPRIDVDKIKVHSGETLSGLVDRFGSRNIELLLVSDEGTVQNVSRLLKPGTDAKSFVIGMQKRNTASESQPQLLLAIASARPLAALRPAQPVAAKEFFAAVLAEAAKAGQSLAATAKYFRLE
jgi:serine/threonine-protein kinase